MNGKYEIKKTKNGQFMFNLKAANGEVILTSESYTTKVAATNGVESVRINSPLDGRYERRESGPSKKPYFVLKAGNGEIVGTSEMYSSAAAMEAGIKAVKSAGPTAPVVDLT